MASMVAKVSSSCAAQISPLLSIQEKGSRNKRKFRAEPLLGDPNRLRPLCESECIGYEFSAEKFEASPGHGPSSADDLCGVSQDHSDALKLNLGFSSAMVSSEAGPSHPGEDLEPEESHDADWSDMTESLLEELVLSNLDAIFKSAIKKIISNGYTEEVATKAILRSGLCYGCKDTVSNIVDNTLQFLRNGPGIDPSREQCFDDLQQLEKYILAELVCVLREVRPFFSTGDAMWCLLICDMNVSHACAMDGDIFGCLTPDGASNGTSSVPNQTQLKTEAKCSELNVVDPCKQAPSLSCSQGSQSEAPINSTGASSTNGKSSTADSGPVLEKESSNSALDMTNKTFTLAGTSQSPILEEKFTINRKLHSGNSKREYILRQKSLHLEKGFRTYGTKLSRERKLSGLSGLILDKKLKSVSDSVSVNLKNTTIRTSKTMGVHVPQDSRNQNVLSFPASSSISSSVGLETLPTENQAGSPSVSTPPTLSAADTELSLSMPTKTNPIQPPVGSIPDALNSGFTGILYDKSLAQWVAHDKKDEMILKLLPKVRELQNQLQEWNEWANHKVMQAARRLSKDKAELKTLRQEKEEVERLKKEKQTLEENTMKKLTEMENALSKASGQVERANSAVRRLEVENAALRQEMEAAKLRAMESAATCQEVSKREKKTLMKFQLWEKQKPLLQEELVTEKHKVAQLLQDLEQAKQLQEQQEARWRLEEKAKEELLMQASLIRKEREQIEASAKYKEDMIKSKAENNLHKYKDDIQRLEKEISQLRLKTDSSKIAALRSGINGSYASRLAEVKNTPPQKESCSPYISEAVTNFQDGSETGGVKRERECVMCLSEEMSVIFLPCAHQVVCTTCNDLHEKQGIKDCPSCRSSIQRRVPVRYACS